MAPSRRSEQRPSGHGVAVAPAVQRHQQPVLQHLQTRVLGELQHVDAADRQQSMLGLEKRHTAPWWLKTVLPGAGGRQKVGDVRHSSNRELLEPAATHEVGKAAVRDPGTATGKPSAQTFQSGDGSSSSTNLPVTN